MKNNQKILFVSVGLIAFGIYLFFKQKSVLVEENIETETGKADWNKVLKKGSQGIEVEVLQKALKQLTVDGDFGGLTETRLKRVMGVTETSINKYNEFIKNKK